MKNLIAVLAALVFVILFAPDPATAAAGLALAGGAGVLDVVGVGPLQGYKQGAGNPLWLAFCEHRFTADAHGALEHWTDGRLRATVPPEGWAEYVKLWPDAAGVVKQLTRAPVPAPRAEAARAKGKGRKR